MTWGHGSYHVLQEVGKLNGVCQVVRAGRALWVCKCQALAHLTFSGTLGGGAVIFPIVETLSLGH